MKKVHLSAQFKIHSGKSQEFKDLIPQCISRVKDNEPGAERYEWYFNSEGTVCQVLETYSDSKAVLAHMGNLEDLLGKAISISDFSCDIYGNLSEELKSAISNFPFTTFTLYQSL